MTKKIKLVATDMDGTFLDAQGNFVRKRLEAVLERFQDKQILFVAASGRSHGSLSSLFSHFKHQMAFVSENGGMVQYQGKTLFESFMDPNQYREIYQKVLENPYNQGHELLFSGERQSYVLKETPRDYVDFIRHYYPDVQIIDDLEAIDDRIMKVTTNFPAEHIFQGEAWLNDQLPYIHAVTTGFASIDVILRGVNKGQALKKLCQELGLSPDEVLVFGDNLNDFEMMTFAGTAIAPANARSQIKEIADLVIADHSQESVMAYMEELVR